MVNGVMIVGTLLDPRLKLIFFKIYFPYIYGEKYSDKIEDIKEFCNDLVKEYEKKLMGKKAMNSSHCTNLEVEEQSASRIMSWKTIYKSHQSGQKGSVQGKRKSELDIYLDEGVFPLEELFDILGWWKQNGLTCCLSKKSWIISSYFVADCCYV